MLLFVVVIVSSSFAIVVVVVVLGNLYAFSPLFLFCWYIFSAFVSKRFEGCCCRHCPIVLAIVVDVFCWS